jgi:phosphopantothenoylcysteine decarboxylase/phosphopantothenate--cysteine ligase
MGFALAEAAVRRGAEVTVVAGVTTVEPPAGVRVVQALSAEDMLKAVASEAGRLRYSSERRQSQIIVGQRANHKIKKNNDSITLTLERTPDVLSHVATSRANGMLVVGFAAETENVIENAKGKAASKNLDAIVAKT